LFHINTDNIVYNYYSIVIIYINIFIYLFLFCFFFNILFLFDQKNFKALSDLKIFSKLDFLTLTIISILLSMSGIPPFIGFIGKLLVFIFFFQQHKYIYVILFSILSFFTIYFYIQNLRFLIGKTTTSYLPKKGFFNFLNPLLINSIVFLSFINLFGIFYMEDILYFFIQLVLFKSFF